MSQFREFYFGERSKADKSQIIESVKNSNSYNKSGIEEISNAEAILLRESKYQNSWLVRTNKRIYKVLDDIRKEGTTINWSRSIEKFNKSQNVNVMDYKPNTGKIVFKHKLDKEYRYSKKLFSNMNIENAIDNFVNKHDL